jgi:ethanolamine utilization protein EutQ (cupin superfamily)
MVWECSQGKFNWYYDFDETVLILEGSILLESDTMPSKRYVAGDVIFFKDGAHARWHIEDRVRKLAFCRKTQPVWLGFALRVFLKLKKIMIPAGQRQAASLMGSS